jgi:hypothetical protein
LLPEPYAGRIATFVSCVVCTAVQALKADHVATFLGRQLTGAYADELGDDFHTRVEGTQLKHPIGPVAVYC